MRRILILSLVLVTCVINLQSAWGGVDRQLRCFEDGLFSFENRYFQTGSTIFVRVLGTAGALDPKIFVRVIGVEIEVDLVEDPPRSGIYKTSFVTSPVETSDAEDKIRTVHNSQVEIRSDIDGDGVQGTTDFLNLTMDDQPPGRVRLCEANATLREGGVWVNWTQYKGKDFRRYNVVRATNQSFSDEISVGNVTDAGTSEWFDPEYNILSGLEYWYGVRVVDMAGNPSSIRPCEYSVVPYNDTTPPKVVVGLEISVPDGGNSIELGWNASLEPDVVGYLVYHAQDPSPMRITTIGGVVSVTPSQRRYEPLPDRDPPTPVVLIGFTRETNFNHPNISANYDHYYKVAAIDEEENESPASEIVGNTSDDTVPPGAPKGLGISMDETGYVNLSWIPPIGEEVFVYNIYRSIEPGAQKFWLPFAKTQNTFYLDEKVEHGKRYYYVVRARDVAGNEEKNLFEVAATSMDETPPGAPRDLKATDTTIGGRIKLTWMYPLGERPSEYLIYRSTVSGGQNYTSHIGRVSNPFFTDRDVVDGVLYYYVVRSVDGAGNTDTNTNEISVMSLDRTPPPPVTWLTATPQRREEMKEGGSIRIHWLSPTADVSDASPEQIRQWREDTHHYHVYWNTYEGFSPDPSKMINTTETFAIHRDLIDGQEYHYIVRSVDAVGNENLRDPSTSAFADTGPPGSPTGLRTLRLRDGRIKVDWLAPAGEVPYSYRIYRARSSGGHLFTRMPYAIVTNETEWVDDNVTDGLWYFYVVRSSDFLLNEDSNVVEVGNFSEDLLPPGAPTQLVVSNLAGGDLMVNWSEPLLEAVSGVGGPRDADRAVSYRVYSSVVSGGQDFSRFIAETSETFIVDRGLRDGEQYFYVVRSVDRAGNEDQNRGELNGTADASPPWPPLNVSVRRTIKGEVVLSWDDPGGEEVYEYRIYRFLGNESQSFLEPFVWTRKNLFIDNDAAEPVEYRYVIRSVDRAGNEGRNTIETVAPVLLGPPIDVVAKPTKNGGVDVFWKPPSEGGDQVREYNVHRSVVPGVGQDVPWERGVLGTHFVDQDRVVDGVTRFMVHGTRYYYTLRAVDLYGNEGIESEEVSAVSDKEAPQKPVSLEAIAQKTGTIWLRWSTPPGERVAEYNIYRATRSGDFNFMVLLTSTTRIHHYDEDTKSGTTYYYVVRSVDEAGNEEQNTVEVSAVAFDYPPDPPKSLRATVRQDGAIILSWSPPTGERISHYNIYRSSVSGVYNFDEPYNRQTVATFTDEFVEHGEQYFYVVRAVDATENEETNEIEVSATSMDRKPPGRPKNLEATPIGTGMIRLFWSHPDGEVPFKYNIYRSQSPFFTPGIQNHLNVTAGRQHIDMGLGDSQTYFYVVRSVDVIGNEDQNTNRVGATTPPGPPEDLQATGNDRGQIVLLWKSPTTPVQFFRIYRTTTRGVYNFTNPIKEVAYPTNSHIDTGLNHSQTYFYVVRSVDAGGAEETNLVEVWDTSMEAIPPLPPIDLSVGQVETGAIDLVWSHTNPTDVSVYKIYRSTGAPNIIRADVIATTNVTMFSDGLTVSGRTYSYLVRAVDIHGNEEKNENWVSMMSIDVSPPPPPQNLSAQALSGGSIELSWHNPPEHNLTYTIYRATNRDPSNVTLLASVNTTTYLDIDTINGREYFYIVRSVDPAGNEEKNETMVSAVASKSGPRILLALTLVLAFLLAGYVVDKKRKTAETEAGT